METVILKNSRHMFLPVAASGAGKTTFGEKYFNDFEIGGGDKFRELLGGSTHYTRNLDRAAFDLLEKWVDIQTQNGVLIYLDNLNLRAKYRKKYVEMARERGYTIHYILFEDSRNLELLLQQNMQRKRVLPSELIEKLHLFYTEDLDFSILEEEADVIHTHTQANPLTITRQAPVTLELDSVVFVGDIHSQFDKLANFLFEYGIVTSDNGTVTHVPKLSPHFVFLGDYVDRGPKPAETLRLIKHLCNMGSATALLGNHDDSCKNAMLKESKALKGYTDNARSTVALLKSGLNEAEYYEIQQWLCGLPITCTVNVGSETYVCSHAGIYYHVNHIPGTELLPTAYTKDLYVRGFMDGTTQRRPGIDKEFRTITHPAHVADNVLAPYYIVYGHFNQSQVQTGEFVVPHVVMNTICLESHIENSEEHDVGSMLG